MALFNSIIDNKYYLNFKTNNIAQINNKKCYLKIIKIHSILIFYKVLIYESLNTLYN